MCLIIYKPANATVPTALLTSAIKENPDGFGVMFAENGKLNVVKDVDSSKVFEPVFRHTDKELLIHLRWATHGKVSPENTHPFKVDTGLWFMHNGVITIDTKDDPTKSDTWWFNERVVKPSRHAVFEAGFEDFLKCPLPSLGFQGIGNNNRLVFLDSQGRIQIINRGTWIEWEGLLLSNTYAYDAFGLGVIDKRPSNYYGTNWYDHEADSTGLLDLQGLSLKEIKDLCWEDPELIAEMIHDYLNQGWE